MGKGWVASMLKPSKMEEGPMERLYALKNAELKFFEEHEEDVVRQLNEQGSCGTSALVERLQEQYSSYLNRFVKLSQAACRVWSTSSTSLPPPHPASDFTASGKKLPSSRSWTNSG